MMMQLIGSFFSVPKVERVNGREYKVVKQLGEGGFSFVYLVQDSRGNQFALKKVRIALPEQEERIYAEIEAHKSVDCPNVIKLVDHELVKEGRRVREGLLLLPFFSGGTVQDMIDSGEGIALGTILRISIDVCKGLLAFQDLKPANILLSGNRNTAVLMDLGSVSPARISLNSRKEAVALQEYCAESVTAPYRAPELFEPPSNGTVDEKCDVWALGCTIFAMAFVDGSATAAIGGQVIFPSRNPYGDSFRLFLTSLLQTDPKNRPPVRDVLLRAEGLLSATGAAYDQA